MRQMETSKSKQIVAISQKITLVFLISELGGIAVLSDGSEHSSHARILAYSRAILAARYSAILATRQYSLLASVLAILAILARV